MIDKLTEERLRLANQRDNTSIPTEQTHRQLPRRTDNPNTLLNFIPEVNRRNQEIPILDNTGGQNRGIDLIEFARVMGETMARNLPTALSK